MKTSPKGLALIKEFEGLRLNAYLCAAGVWTIGFGHTSAAGDPEVRPGMRITATQAEAMLIRDLGQYERAVSAAVKKPLTQGQFDACVSLCYNIGVGAFARSTVVRRINAGRMSEVPAAFMMWTKGGGKVLPGLVRRRRAEAALWRSLPDETGPAGRGEVSEVEEDRTEIPATESKPFWMTVVSWFAGLGLAFPNIENLYGLIAFLAILTVGGVFAWLVLSGRITFNRGE